MFEVTAETSADREHAWTALVDVTSWPRWTTSVSEVRRLDDGPLAVGSAARVKQPGMPALVWRVTQLRGGESFSWRARSPGVRTLGHHRLTVGPSGHAHLTLGVEHRGPLAWLVEALTARRTRRYLRMELAGLKAAAEQASAQGG